MSGPILRIISLGAGVQSTAMALMAEHSDIGPKPDAAFFADTEREGSATYLHLEWLTAKLSFPVHRIGRGNLIDALFSGDDEARIPAFVKAGGLAKRQCTRNFKIREIRRAGRRLLGAGPRSYIAPGAIEQWIGISTDEADRMKPSGVGFVVNRFPLLDKEMSRADCKRWLLAHGYPIPPKSSCIDCAFQSDRQWAARTPEELSMAADTDRRLRSPENVKRFRGELYLHRSCRPLDEIDFAALISKMDAQLDLFANDCDGACGL